MIYIIDYGLKNLYEIFKQGYGSEIVKIGDNEVTLSQQLMTLTEIPDKILKKIILQKRIEHYEYNSQVLTNEEWLEQWKKLRKNGFWDGEDEDIWVFDTREDKSNFEEFERNWKPIYLEPEIKWEETSFEIIKKQFIEEKYRPFIVSQIVITNNSGKVESICQYYPSFEQMFRKIGNDYGFIEVEDKSFSDNTKGKKFSFHSGIKYSKCNGEYVTKFFENKGLFSDKKGTYEDCIVAFERDYNAISTYLKLQLAKINQKEISSLTLKECYDLIQHIKSTARNVDSMKSTRSEYNSLLKLISSLEEKILNETKTNN